MLAEEQNKYGVALMVFRLADDRNYCHQSGVLEQLAADWDKKKLVFLFLSWSESFSKGIL